MKINKIGQNQICPLCNSGKKFKRCCGIGGAGKLIKLEPKQVPPEVMLAFRRHQAKEKIRTQQQGFGRPIISGEHAGHRIVAVGDTVHFERSEKWRTLPDFLTDYLRKLLSGIPDTHIVRQWFSQYGQYRKMHAKRMAGEEIFSAAYIGVINCFLGLAYNLYLLKHNVELQKRYIDRLGNMEQFQGAYYELIVANILIRAGFELALEDETDSNTKHCEFSAVSKKTGKKYWVEAKMRAVAGVLGKTTVDGGNDLNPTSKIVSHLNNALAKPAPDERIIFIDVNALPGKAESHPQWFKQAEKKLEKVEGESSVEGKGYVFVTNIPYHRALEEQFVPTCCIAFGFRHPDFGKAGKFRLQDIYRNKQKHIDAHNISEAFSKYPHIPNTFNGELESEAFGKGAGRLLIDETYYFSDIEGGVLATVTAGSVFIPEKEETIAIYTEHGKTIILKREMTDQELADYRNHPESYFGQIQHVGKNSNNPYDLFEFILSNRLTLTKEQLLEQAQSTDIEYLRSLSQMDLALEIAERMTWHVVNRNEAKKH